MKVFNLKEAISNIEAMEDATAVTTPVTAKLKKDMKKKYQEFEKITTSEDNFLGAKKQPIPKKVEVPKSQAKLDLDESLFESSDKSEEKDFVDAYTWMFGGTKKKALEVYKKEKSGKGNGGGQSYIDNIIKGFKGNSKKSILSDNLQERNLTKAERHNRDMENIFNRYNKLKDNEAKFLISKGVPEEEVNKLRKDTGLGRDAIEDKMIELGVRDEFFEKGRIFESKKKKFKKLKESKKPLKEAEYSDELSSEITSALEDMDESELCYTWNNYCDKANYPDDYIYPMDEIDEVLDGVKPWDILRSAFYGDFKPVDKFFKFDGYANLQSIEYIAYEIDMSDLVDYIIENDDELGSDDIRLILDQAEDDVEESLKESNDGSLNQKAKFAQRESNDGNKRWVLSNDDGRVRLAGSEEELKKLQSKGYEIELVFQNGKDVTFDENLKEDKDSSNVAKPLDENVQPLNEGPGAGYTIESTLEITKVNSCSLVSSNKEESTDSDGGFSYDGYSVELDCDVDAVAKSVHASSYYYGDKINEDLPVKISNMGLYVYIPHEQSIEDVDFLNCISQLRDELKTDLVYGGGWIHSTYDGTLAEDADDLKVSPYEQVGDIEFSVDSIVAHIVSEDAINYIDRVVTGDNLEELYVVIDKDDDEIDSFDDEESAIELCDETPGSRVEKLFGYSNFYGDIEDYDIEIIHSNDEEPEDDEPEDDDIDSTVRGFSKYVNADESLQEAKKDSENKKPASKEDFIKKFPKFFYRDNISNKDKLGFEVSDIEDDKEFKEFAKEHGNKVLIKKFNLFDRVLEELAPEHVNIKRITRVPSVEKDDRYDYEDIQVNNNKINLFGKTKDDLKLAENIAKQYENDGVTYTYSNSGKWRGPDKAVKITLAVPVN